MKAFFLLLPLLCAAPHAAECQATYCGLEGHSCMSRANCGTGSCACVKPDSGGLGICVSAN
jgi:hypothetical protein